MNTSADTTPINQTGDKVSLWARKFNITSFESDPWRWNKDWEKVLHTLSASEDVYPMMSQICKKSVWEPEKLSRMSQDLKMVVCQSQKKFMELWVDATENKGDFVTAWVLLEEAERKRHLLKGIEEACQFGIGQDSRALCPEITISSMLRQRGRGFVDFTESYTKGMNGVGEETPYFLPSEWWEKAVGDLPQSNGEGSLFEILTLQRCLFVSRFLMGTVLSVVHDFCYGSAGMDPVLEVMNMRGSFARSWGKTLSSMRDKPLIRCENCTKSPEEIGRDTKFMACSSCKSKLDFTIHYCSQACQKEDWRKHKKHCGKTKVSKNLPGTARDPFWAHPDVPDHSRNVSIQDGVVDISSIGFAKPDPAYPHSPALQRQVSLLTGDKHADYFLFDETDRPIRFIVNDMWMRMTFRSLRADLLSGSYEGLAAIAEYIIKVMAQKPGLSRERILGQLQREYGVDLSTKVAEWEEKAAKNGFEGSTFLEVQSRSTMAMTMAMTHT